MRMKEIAEYEHPTDYVVIPVAMRDRIMTRLNAAEARVKELEGALKEIAVLKWGIFGSSEPADIAERVLRGEESR
jgi:hypothetical protein